MCSSVNGSVRARTPAALHKHLYLILTRERNTLGSPRFRRTARTARRQKGGTGTTPPTEGRGIRATPSEAGPEACAGTARACAQPSCSKTASFPAERFLPTRRGVTRPWRPWSPAGTPRGYLHPDPGPAKPRAAWQELRSRPPGEATAESPGWGSGPRRLWRSGGRTW